ncbi:hypothetical protein [Streptomyces acidiscabies]|uniref:hypothetical protein n=1 Tax=Streptomyces acidiscabies TaxID=42234 RepID=UPI0038F60CF8
MQINGTTETTGTTLLMAAAPVGKIKLIDTGSALTAFAAVPPAAWAGGDSATVVELADPVDPQSVLTRIRSATATEGRLTVVLVGQLQLDHRQRAVHLALARTTRSTLRYTALPWAWLVQALQQRRPGFTTLYLDVVAASEVWPVLADEPLDLPRGVDVHGVIAPPPPRRRTAEPRYTTALAQILRTGQRPDPKQLHRQVLRRIDVVDGTVVLGNHQDDAVSTPTQPTGQVTAPIPTQTAPSPNSGPQQAVSPVYVPSTAVVPVHSDPHDQISALSRAGRHHEALGLAEAAERHAVETYGVGTYAAVHWIEARAYLTSVAHDPRGSTQLWLQAAETRLNTLQQAPDALDVETAVDGAHYQWMQIRDPAAARALAPQLVSLRRRVPGRQRGALDSLQKMVERLNSLPVQ